MAFVKLKEAAPALNVPYQRLRRWALAGYIPAIRTNGKTGTYMVDVEQVQEALKAKAAA